MMIDFERICKEHDKDSTAVILYVDSVREYVNFLYSDNISIARNFLDLPFPEWDKVKFHLGVIQGLTYFAHLAGFINEEEFREFHSEISYISVEGKIPEKLFRLKPW